MSRSINIVQFTHPGGEHTLSATEKKNGSIKGWNYDGHKRKFIKTTGICLDNNGDVLTEQELLFWGEWEPTSYVTPITHFHGTGIMPALVQEPFLQKDYGGSVDSITPWYNGVMRKRKGNLKPCERQNTDPFVFADGFYYCCCKQHFKALRSLDKGSIILFGSTISTKQGGPYFVLDTVFVVDDFRVYTPANYKHDLHSFIPSDYDQMMGFNHWSNPTKQFVCYKGATYSKPINGMYSYVPSRKCNGTVIGFPRVKIDSRQLNGLFSGRKIITDNLNCAPRCTVMTNLNENRQVWDIISQQVQLQGYIKGLSFDYNTHFVP